MRRFLFFFCLLIYFDANAQSSIAQKWRFEQYGIDEGLSIKYINHITQDAQGFLWVAGRGGVYRIDMMEKRL